MWGRGVWGDTNILLLAVLWGFKYHRVLRLRRLAAAHPELSPWFHLAARHRHIIYPSWTVTSEFGDLVCETSPFSAAQGSSAQV